MISRDICTYFHNTPEVMTVREAAKAPWCSKRTEDSAGKDAHHAETETITTSTGLPGLLLLNEARLPPVSPLVPQERLHSFISPRRDDFIEKRTCIASPFSECAVRFNGVSDYLCYRRMDPLDFCLPYRQISSPFSSRSAVPMTAKAGSSFAKEKLSPSFMVSVKLSRPQATLAIGHTSSFAG